MERGGRRLWVNLSDYLDTGLFLDHRPLRARVATEARGRRVLNLFCYTGAFTVHAVGGGATHTTSVDLSATYLQWARENLTLNGMGGPTHRLVREDVMRRMSRDAAHVGGCVHLAALGEEARESNRGDA